MEVKHSCTHLGFYTIGKRNAKLHHTDGVFYWHINNFTPDMDKHSIVLAVRKAFDIWQTALHPLRFESTDDWRKAHIRITFAGGNHDGYDNGHYKLNCKVSFDGESGVLAHAYFADPELHLDEAEKWTECGKPGSVHLLSVLIHEIGHNLNIGHSNVKDAIMYPSYNGPKTELHNDDIRAVHEIYKQDRKQICDRLGIDYYTVKQKRTIWQWIGIG